MEPLTTHRLTHGTGKGRTEVRLAGSESLLVVEEHGEVWRRVQEGEWMVLQLDDEAGSMVHVRCSDVAALRDLGNHE